MFYRLYELGSKLLHPLNHWASFSHHHWHRYVREFPASPFFKLMDANSVVLERDTHYYSRPTFNIQTSSSHGRTVKVIENVVHETSFCRLLHFQKLGIDKQEKVLLIAPLSGHYATLLRNTVETILPFYDVYISDWINAQEIPLAHGDFSLDTYITLIMEWLTHFKGNVHVIAVCQPTVPATAAVTILQAARSASCPRSLTLMGGPIDTRINPSFVNNFSSSHTLSWFQENVIQEVPSGHPGAGRKVCPGFLMLSGFISLNPERHWTSHLQFYENLVEGSGEKIAAHTKFYDEYRSVMDLPGTYFLDTVDKVFQRHCLPKGDWSWNGHKIDLKDIHDLPIFTIEGEKDDISPPGQTSILHALTPNLPATLKFKHFQEGVGHYGIFSGRTWQSSIFPQIQRFIDSAQKHTLYS